MPAKNEDTICEFHERLLNRSMQQIDESLNTLQVPVVKQGNAEHKDDSPATKEVPVPHEEHSGPEKINEIRNEAAADQPGEILDPGRQGKLMEIVKQGSEEFERGLRAMNAVDESTIKSSSQKFQDDLINYVSEHLEKKYVLEH